jgi:hypothetical protein
VASAAVTTRWRTHVAETEAQDGVKKFISKEAKVMAATERVSDVRAKYQLCGPRLLRKRMGRETIPTAWIATPWPFLHLLEASASSPA